MPDLLRAIPLLIYLDQYDDAHLVMMAAVEGDQLDPQVESDYLAAITPTPPTTKASPASVFDFYDRTRNAFAVVMTGRPPNTATVA